ncbi:proliferating cell nuclear antigen [Dionaea muscipula]
MFLLKVQQGGLLKGATAAIAGIDGANSMIELSPNAMLIRVVHRTGNILAVLKMKASGFYHYSCNKAYFVDVNIQDLFYILSSAADDDLITISGHDPTTRIFFKFENLNTRQCRLDSLAASETSSVRWTTDESAYQCCIGLSSADFRDKFNHLKRFQEIVKITISEKMVKLAAGLADLILRKEAEECQIQGVDGGGLHKLKISLLHFESFVKASWLTPAVWIHKSSTIPPLRPLISFPLGRLGTIMFYVPRPFYYVPSSE